MMKKTLFGYAVFFIICSGMIAGSAAGSPLKEVGVDEHGGGKEIAKRPSRKLALTCPLGCGRVLSA